ncbi:MAG: hypothetical protein ACRD5W_05980 [Candidatus Acidiferrales bacterium]
MPKYISMHTLACLTRQGAEELAKRVFAASVAGGVAGAGEAKDAVRATGRRVAVNMIEGKMLVEWEAGDRDSLESWLKTERFHYDWVMRIELESTGGPLQPS